ncbi:MAG: SDR family NAD(P)-dependent oxidoreductase [Ahrensia sp.]|nr:SDR family NAD(P)-dependent oxidoreductase [Ahrensia sp.]
MSNNPLADRIALVTGASRGIGHHTAVALAREGAHVIALARTVGGLEDLDDAIREEGGSATLVPLDLKDSEALDRLGESILGRWGRLDILVANAGILGTPTPLHQLKPETFDDVFAVNVTANFRLIRALQAPLQQAEAPQALFVSSGAARSKRPFVGTYAASKAALEALVVSWAKEHANTPLKANLFTPGVVATRMRGQYAPGEDQSKLTQPRDVGAEIARLLAEGMTETGRLYDFDHKHWLDV